MKVTKEVDDALKQFADRLPSTETVELAPRSGAELLKKYGGKLTQPDGKPLNPAARYRIGSASCAVNHLKRLRRAYELGGMPSVVRYLQPFEAFLHTPESEPVAPAAAEASLQPEAALQPRAAEGFPEGALELGCGDCASCAAPSCPTQAPAAAAQPVKKRKARRIAIVGTHA